MDIFVVVGIKDNAVESDAVCFSRQEAIDAAWSLIKDDLFFEEIDEHDEPYIPEKNPFDSDSRAENSEGSASIEILSYVYVSK